MERKELQVAALKNGTVIDHIPSSKLFQVVSLLHLDRMEAPVTIGYNLKSGKMGNKAIVKVADKFFTDEDLNKLAAITPQATLCVIRDYEVVEKKDVLLPDHLVGIVKCNNPKCISNNEPMATKFDVVDKLNRVVKCHYCNHEQKLDK